MSFYHWNYYSSTYVPAATTDNLQRFLPTSEDLVAFLLRAILGRSGNTRSKKPSSVIDFTSTGDVYYLDVLLGIYMHFFIKHENRQHFLVR